MNFLEVYPATVQLRGITRTAVFHLKNRNDFLAASYKIECLTSGDHDLTVFPEKGMLLGGQEQTIRVKYIGQNTESSLSQIDGSVRVDFTFKTDYNRHNLTKNGMKSWEQVPNETYSKLVDVQMGGEREVIENCIKEDIVFAKTFGSDNLNISAIKPKEKSFLEDLSFDNLQIDSKAPELQRNLHQSDRVIEPDMSVVSQFKLEPPSSNLFPLQYGESRVNSSALQRSASKVEREKIKTVESRIVNEQLSKSFILSMRTAQCQDFSSQLNDTLSHSQNRTLDLIILAVIAAFFVALGNNLGRILG